MRCRGRSNHHMRSPERQALPIEPDDVCQRTCRLRREGNVGNIGIGDLECGDLAPKLAVASRDGIAAFDPECGCLGRAGCANIGTSMERATSETTSGALCGAIRLIAARGPTRRGAG